MFTKIDVLKPFISILHVLFVLFSSNSFAERLLPMDFIGQVQMSVKDLNTYGCGIRFVGVQTPTDLNNKAELIWLVDASFMIYRNGMGLVKALIAENKISEMITMKNNYKAFNTFWMKADNHPITSPIKGKAVDGETTGSKIYGTDIDSLINLYSTVIAGEQFKLGYKFKDKSKDMIFYGKVSLKEDEILQVQGCINELTALMEKDTFPDKLK
jgi:uncharacterized protein (DUF2147 family)